MNIDGKNVSKTKKPEFWGNQTYLQALADARLRFKERKNDKIAVKDLTMSSSGLLQIVFNGTVRFPTYMIKQI